MSEPLVMIPGTMCDSRLFTAQLTAFCAARAVMIAAPTQGERVEEIASNLLGQMPPRFALAGMSFGGAVAMEMLRRAPDRVTRIALIATTPLADTPQQAADRESLIVQARAGRLDEALQALVRPDHLAPGPGRMRAFDSFREMARDLGPEVLTRQIRALQRRRDQQATLRQIKVPSMVMCGAHDGAIPLKRHEFMAGLIPHCRLAVLHDAGHLAPLEQPEAVTEELRAWLKQPFVLQ